MNDAEIQVKPRFALVKIDETEYWSPDIQEKVGRIFGVYIVDLSCRTFCCEVTPSYSLHFVESQWVAEISEDEIEAFQDEIYLHDDPQGSIYYFHCHTVDAFPKIEQGAVPTGNNKSGIVLLDQWNNTVEHWYDEESFNWNDLIEVVGGL